MSDKDDYQHFTALVQKNPGEARELIQALDYYQDEDLEGFGDFEREILGFLPDLELIESYGGEGQGSVCGIVFRFQERVLRLEGSWDSWSGPDFREATLHETEARQVVSTVYENTQQVF